MHNHLAWYQQQLRSLFTKEELAALMRKSDWRGMYEVLHTWLYIGGVLALAGWHPAWYTIILALVVLGGKQLACAIIMHDCSHDALFETRALNSICGNWLGAYPIFQNLEQYRPYHREHHIFTGLETDPDLNLVKGYPAKIWGMLRKFARDISGATGIKAQIATLLMHLGIWQYNLAGVVKKNLHPNVLATAWKNLRGPIIFHVLFCLLLWVFGAVWLYGLWWGAFLTTYNFCLRVRSIAEHSMATQREDPQQNTRTTYANFIERLLFAPHYVNYHAEHHLCMGAPPYNLPKMHKTLLQRGFYEKGMLEKNYWHVLKRAVLRPNSDDKQ